MLENINASGIINVVTMRDYTVLLINLGAYASGVLLHVMHKMQRDQISFIQYWVLNSKNSIASIIALTTTFIAMAIMSPEAPLYAFFTTAYMGDSFINKAIDSSSRTLLPPKADEGFMTIFGIATIFVIIMLVLQNISTV